MASEKIAIKRRIEGRKLRFSKRQISMNMSWQDIRITKEEILKDLEKHKNDPNVLAPFFFQFPKMKFIEDLRGTHKKDKIWVAGSGSGLDDYPNDFFKDKICIGVNWVFAAFLDIGDGLEKFETRIFYSLHSHRGPADWIAKHIPHFLKNCFFISHPKSYRAGYTCWQDFNEDPYWIRNSFSTREVNASDTDFQEMAKCIMEKRNDCKYFCRGTTLHWAIETAVVLGAKKIYVVGAHSRCQKDRYHAQKRGLAKFYKQPPGPRYSTTVYGPHFLQGTKWLAEVFKPYGVEIVQHHYETGEVKLN